MQLLTPLVRGLSLVVLFSLLSACSSVYYKAAESVGYNKREIMVDRVESAQSAQEEAQETFLSAFEQFRGIVQFEGGDLEDMYDEMKDEYDESVDKAETVRSRIAAVKDVSEALFDEWKEELALYSNTRLRQDSERKYKETRYRYASMIKAMEQAERSMEPVLAAFQDQVLYLKHNLNARAVASLKGEFTSLKSDIDGLIKDMKRSIDRSNAFVTKLKQ